MPRGRRAAGRGWQRGAAVDSARRGGQAFGPRAAGGEAVTAARVVAVVQARLGSTRLPGKALEDIAGRPMLAHVLARTASVPGVDQVVLATTKRSEDDALASLSRDLGIACTRGSTDDVLDRFHSTLLSYPAGVVLRVTGDCPFLDPMVVQLVLDAFVRSAGTVDYVSNEDPPAHRWVVDTEADLAFARQIYASLDPPGGGIFGMAEVLAILRRRPELRALNGGVRRNEGLEHSRARDVAEPRRLPGGRIP